MRDSLGHCLEKCLNFIVRVFNAFDDHMWKILYVLSQCRKCLFSCQWTGFTDDFDDGLKNILAVFVCSVLLNFGKIKGISWVLFWCLGFLNFLSWHKKYFRGHFPLDFDKEPLEFFKITGRDLFLHFLGQDNTDFGKGLCLRVINYLG